ncbi:hypothetical protein SAMN05444487_1334 [Marininema mesophilum]|uniref:Collagen triple helix repeat-containing protein n=1 Tax=Marininema mesophilum TaxID=1048340 RepID=A0A1H3D1F3_9BACL|nr:collagen-like protein [Marininema mesophilum]SDX59509.1 hypothetical protein SAMN05444487_1334 [Marininema mesophilum]
MGVPGQRGPRGPQGIQGPRGPQGPIGFQGVVGPRGRNRILQTFSTVETTTATLNPGGSTNLLEQTVTGLTTANKVLVQVSYTYAFTSLPPNAPSIVCEAIFGLNSSSALLGEASLFVGQSLINGSSIAQTEFQSTDSFTFLDTNTNGNTTYSLTPTYVQGESGSNLQITSRVLIATVI